MKLHELNNCVKPKKMNDTFEADSSSKAFFEMFQIDDKFEVKSIIPCSLYETLLIAHSSEIDYLVEHKTKGILFNYIEENLIVIDKNGNKLGIKSVVNLGRDEESKTMTFELLFESVTSEIKWVTNTFLFDMNSSHENYHMLNEEDNDFIITNSYQSRFEFPSRESNNRLVMAALLVAMVVIAFAIYQANV